MKLAETISTEIYSQSHRLDASYHASESIAALKFIREWSQAFSNVGLGLERLSDLCEDGGIYIPSRFKRIFVRSAEHGAPYLTGSSVTQADPLRGVKYLSYKHTNNLQNLLLKLNMIIVTCSGTIGNAVFINDIFQNTVGSPDLLRIVANHAKVQPGYLFAFLSSPLGRLLIEQKTYGSVVPHIEAHHLYDLPILRIGSHEVVIHNLIEKASQLRVEADAQLQAAKAILTNEVSFSDISHQREHQYTVGSSTIDPEFSYRLDSFCYVGYVSDALETLKNFAGKVIKASEAGYTIYNPPIFKRMFAPQGFPYMSGVDLYTAKPTTNRFLSRKQPNIDQYLVSKGMVLLQSAGQRYGLNSTPLLVTNTLDGVAVTSDIVRIVHQDIVENGYICSLFASEFGRRLALRYTYGTSIPRINVPQFAHIEIPWPEKSVRRTIGEMTITAYEKREQANQLEDESQTILLNALGWPTQ